MNFYALMHLTRRNLKIFLKDKANVFFSLLSPLIVLLLYALFLGQLQEDGILAALGEPLKNDETVQKTVQAFCDSWMLAGAMACASLTVPLCACTNMIQDRSRGISSDLMVSPAARWVTPASYFLSVMAAGAVIGLIVLGICFIWLAASGSWFLSVGDVFGCIGTLLLSVLSASTLFVFVVGFLKSEGAFTAVNVIFGTVVGFLIGAYMPLTQFPEAIQKFALFLPGSYAAGLFRNFFMGGSLEELGAATVPAFADGLREEFSFTFDFFGLEVGIPGMFGALAIAAVLFAALFVLVASLKGAKKG